MIESNFFLLARQQLSGVWNRLFLSWIFWMIEQLDLGLLELSSGSRKKYNTNMISRLTERKQSYYLPYIIGHPNKNQKRRLRHSD